MSWWRVVSLKVTSGRLDLLRESIVFHLRNGADTVVCSISHAALRDLGDCHGIRSSEVDVFSTLLHNIEHLATAKFRAGRIDENGQVNIGTSDLVRFGPFFRGHEADGESVERS